MSLMVPSIPSGKESKIKYLTDTVKKKKKKTFPKCII